MKEEQIDERLEEMGTDPEKRAAPYLGIFRQKFGKTIAIFEISALEPALNQILMQK